MVPSTIDCCFVAEESIRFVPPNSREFCRGNGRSTDAASRRRMRPRPNARATGRRRRIRVSPCDAANGPDGTRIFLVSATWRATAGRIAGSWQIGAAKLSERKLCEFHGAGEISCRGVRSEWPDARTRRRRLADWRPVRARVRRRAPVSPRRLAMKRQFARGLRAEFGGQAGVSAPGHRRNARVRFRRVR